MFPYTSKSLLNLPTPMQNNEIYQSLLLGEGIRIERIVSNETTPSNTDWYDQEEDEWVMIVSGSAVLEDMNGDQISLHAGEYIYLPRHFRHQVVSTTTPCIWLAIFGSFTPADSA